MPSGLLRDHGSTHSFSTQFLSYRSQGSISKPGARPPLLRSRSGDEARQLGTCSLARSGVELGAPSQLPHPRALTAQFAVKQSASRVLEYWKTQSCSLNREGLLEYGYSRKATSVPFPNSGILKTLPRGTHWMVRPSRERSSAWQGQQLIKVEPGSLIILGVF